MPRTAIYTRLCSESQSSTLRSSDEDLPLKHYLTILALLLASALCGCTILPGSAADPDSPAAKLQTVLRGHPDETLNRLTVTEYNGILQVHGFVNSFRQKNSVEALISGYAASGELGFDGRIVSRVGLYADYDCRASNECITENKCSTEAQCFANDECGIDDECR